MRSTALLMLALSLSACGDPAPPAGQDSSIVDQLAPAPDGFPASDAGLADGSTAGTCPTGAAFDVSLRKVLLTAFVDGDGPYKLIYDTGAPSTVLSPTITGAATGAMHTVTTIDLGDGVKIGPVNAYTYPMSPYFDGIIGNDAIGKRAVSIDYPRRRLWVSDEAREADLLACAHLEGKPARSPITVAPYPFVQGEVDGVAGTLLVDTGASLGGVEQGVLDSTGKGNPQVDGYKMTISLGTFWSGYTMVGRMSVGKHSVKRITMYTMPDASLPKPTSGSTLATLPYGFMQHFLVTLDFGAMELRLDAGKTAKLVDDFVLYGYGLSLSTNASGPVTVTRVISGSPADLSGIEKGDTVQAVDGADPASTAPEGRINLVLVSKPGTPRGFRVLHAGVAADHALVAADLFGGFAP